MAGLEVRELTNKREFLEIKPLWEKFFQKAGSPSPFLHPGWFEACLEYYTSPSLRVVVVLVLYGTDIVGIFPLCWEPAVFRHVKVSVVRSVQCPDSPFVDFLIRSDMEEDCIRAFLTFLIGEKHRSWDVVILEKLPRESPRTTFLLQVLKETNRQHYLKVTGAMPCIAFQGSWEEFFQSKTVRFRKAKRNIINKMSRLKDVQVECIRTDPEGMALKEFFRIGEKGWKFQEGKSVSNSGQAKRFFEILTHECTKSQCLMLWFLKSEGRPIAVEYDLISGRVVYALRSEFDQAYQAFSPGAFLEMEILQRLFESEFVEYNSGQGLNDYKLRWTDNVQETVTLEIYNSTLRGNVAGTLETAIVPVMKWIRGKYYKWVRGTFLLD